MQLHLGDCLEIMPQIPDKSVDMILCDLPYGTTACPWDTVIPFDKLWEQYNRIIKDSGAIVLTASQPFTTDLINSNRKLFKHSLVWKKNVPTGMVHAKYRPMKYHEDILVFNTTPKSCYNPIMQERVGLGKECYNYNHYFGKSNHVALKKIKKKYDPLWVQPGSVLEFSAVPNRINKLHPTQKPVALMEYLIKTYSNPGDIILDNCMGSGTTGVACANLGRKFIGIEIEPKYFEIANKRITVTG